MAISFVGAVGGQVGGTDLTVNWTDLRNESGVAPTVQSGDCVIVTLAKRFTSASAPAITTAGYAPVYDNIWADASTNDTNLQSFYKFITTDTGVVITTAGTSNVQAYTVTVLRGVDPTTPFEAFSADATTAGAASPDAGSVTPLTPGAWIMACGGAAGSTTAGNIHDITGPANMDLATNHAVFGTNTRAGVGTALYSGWTSGAFDPASFGGGSTTAGGSVAAKAFAIKPASAASYSLTAASGAFTLTGQAAGLKAGRKITALAGSFTLTGIAATARAGRKITASAGAFNLGGNALHLAPVATNVGITSASDIAGIATGLRNGRTLAAASGSFSVAGSAAGLRTAKRFTASAGTFALSGPTVGLSLGHLLAAASGSFALAGGAARLATGYALPVSAGAFAFTGIAANLSSGVFYRLAASAGAFALTGPDAALRQSHVLGAISGSFTFSGNAAELVFEHLAFLKDAAPAEGALTSIDAPGDATLTAIAAPEPAASFVRILPPPSVTLG